MRPNLFAIAACGLLLGGACSELAAAIVFSPDEKRLATARTEMNTGPRHVIRIIDTESLDVLKRVWHPLQIDALCWSKDGGRLLVADTPNFGQTIVVYDTKDWSVAYEVKDRRLAAFAPMGDLFLTYKPRAESLIEVRSTQSGEIEHTFSLPEGVNAGYAVISKDSEPHVYILTKVYEDPKAEKRGERSRPTGFRVKLADHVAYTKQDGKVCDVLVVRLSDGKVLHRQVSHFVYRANFHAWGDGAATYNSDGYLMEIAKDGKTRMVAAPTSFLVTPGYSRDGSKISTQNGLLEVNQKEPIELTGARPIDRDRGREHGVTVDGRVFVIMSSQRMLKYDPDGKLVKEAPVP